MNTDDSEEQRRLQQSLDELQLLQCSLLPDEHLHFLDGSETWDGILANYDGGNISEGTDLSLGPASFSIRLDGSNIWFDITLPIDQQLEGSLDLKKCVSVKGEGITRAEQEKWQGIIAEKLEEISDSEYPIYQLVSLHLLPQLREETEKQATVGAEATESHTEHPSTAHEIYHVLFSSHHLISPNKRRSLQQWTSSLSLEGFAKVGYPGVIYAQGERQNVEEFVENVKAMQWLALKVRFVEPLPARFNNDTSARLGRWKEFQKVGEVLEEMRRVGREEYVVEMGIGSAGTKS
ncbi:hypothetical protein CPC08DRAFT_644792 [Agrocybe pediades]|nr:hypothetical protein CPC08DRAFT_644792 [Agrocybe pediades]